LLYRCDTPFIDSDLLYRCDTPFIDSDLLYRCDTPFIDRDLLYRCNTPFIDSDLLCRCDTPFIDSDLLYRCAVHVEHISQLIRYSRACGSHQDYLDRGLLLTRKLLNQGFLLVKLKSSLQ
jgi:molybdopterin-guanine dinucleotide biosynthesis protein A